MSDDDRDIDIESDDDIDSDSKAQRASGGATQYFSQAEKRAHHNALERKRRDHIKDSFTSLRDSVPSLQGEKVASRAQILKKAAEYITFMRQKNMSHQHDIDELKRQNNILENQIRQLERQRSSYEHNDFSYGTSKSSDHHTSESDMSDEDDEQAVIESLPTTNGVRRGTINNRKIKNGGFNSKGGY